MRNVSEYVLVLALCVVYFIYFENSQFHIQSHGNASGGKKLLRLATKLSDFAHYVSDWRRRVEWKSLLV